MKYESVIGLEVHAELKTKTKIFLRVQYVVRSGTEYACMPCLPGASRGLAHI